MFREGGAMTGLVMCRECGALCGKAKRGIGKAKQSSAMTCIVMARQSRAMSSKGNDMYCDGFARSGIVALGGRKDQQ